MGWVNNYSALLENIMKTIIAEYKTFEKMVNEYVDNIQENQFNIGKQCHINEHCENIIFDHFLGYKYSLENDSRILCQWNYLFSNLDPENEIFNEVLCPNDYIYKSSSLNAFKEYIEVFLKGLQYVIEESGYLNEFSLQDYSVMLSDYIRIFTNYFDINDNVETEFTYNSIRNYENYFSYLSFESKYYYEELARLCNQYAYIMEEDAYDEYIEDVIYNYVKERIPKELMDYFEYDKFEEDYKNMECYSDSCYFDDLNGNTYVFFN